MNTAQLDTIRAEFETWAAREGYDLTRNRWDPDLYLDRKTAHAWRVWAAAKESA
jgi:hypothetical protein